MDAPTPPAAPTPPTESAEPQTPSDALASLSDVEMLEWKKTGELPVRAPAPAETVDEADDDEGDEPEPPAAVVPAGTQPPAGVSKRQQRINDQIRAAVEKATAEKDAELARLRAQPATPREQPKAAPALRAADPNDPAPDPNDLEKYPGGKYDPDYQEARSEWRLRQWDREKAAESQTRERQQHAEAEFRQAVKATSDAFVARGKADPEFKTRLDPALMQGLIPISQLPPDMPGGPLNVIAEEMLAHPDTAPDVAEYLSTHPEDLTRLTAADPRTGVPLLTARQLIRELGRIEGALKRGVEPPPLPNTITDAPAPPTTLGSRSTTPADPAQSAVARGDTAAYIAAENAKELAALRK